MSKLKQAYKTPFRLKILRFDQRGRGEEEEEEEEGNEQTKMNWTREAVLRDAV